MLVRVRACTITAPRVAFDLELDDEEGQMRLPSRLRPPRRRSSAALAALLSAGLLVACGGDVGESANDAAAVRQDVTKALTSTDADDCEPTTHATQRWVDQETYSIPELATQMERLCRADVETYAADAVKVSHVRVHGERATARIEARGGTYGFGRLEVALAKDRSWKLDELTGVDIDRAKFDTTQVQFATIGDGRASKAQTDCSIRRLARLSDRELERAVLTSDVRLVLDPVLVCFLRPELRRQGLSLALTRCVIEALRGTGDALLRVVLKDDQRETKKLFTQAAADCMGGATA
jgi:hypothetical protein